MMDAYKGLDGRSKVLPRLTGLLSADSLIQKHISYDDISGRNYWITVHIDEVN